jgi:hypothetical protein
VDREGADLKAFKAGVDVLVQSTNPLVIFPEGEIYYLADRLTPLREGAAAVAVSAAKKKVEAGKTVWVVPTAIKYRFLPGHDPWPDLRSLMSDLEARYSWWPRTDLPLVERIYHYAEGTLGLMELNHLGAARSGPLKERLAFLRDHILDEMEDRRAGKRRNDTVPVRVKELRKLCLDLLSKPETSPEQAEGLRRDLHHLFLVVQLYSYPGDYIREAPTLERVAEILTKLEEDALGQQDPVPKGPRRAILRLGEPIDVGRLLASTSKPKAAIPVLTAELEERIQHLLDAIGPGRPLEAVSKGGQAPQSLGASPPFETAS